MPNRYTPRHRYTDSEGNSQEISVSALDAMNEYRQEGSAGSGTHRWHRGTVKALQDKGLLEIEWLERPKERIGAWRVTGITDEGKRVLDNWNARQGDEKEK